LSSFSSFSPGLSGLIFETICTRLLTYTFGNTAHALSTVFPRSWAVWRWAHF